MQKVQIYVENVLLDTFNDENIQLTSTIQDVKDIGKVFTDYSHTFTVPASDINNKVFRHYYNYYITTGAYDSRKKKSAEIHINYSPFRRGKVYLNSVKMRFDKPFAYVLIFYGETVSLKDLIGDDEVSELSYLDNFTHEYNETTVRNGFTSGLDFTINSVVKSNAIIYPLISTKKRLFLNSEDPIPSAFYNSNGNLYHKAPGDQLRGLQYTDIKPALKLINIIEAIESQYTISFTRSIRKSDGTDRNTFFSSSDFLGLYMWLHRSKGDLFEYDLEGNELTSFLDDFTSSSSASSDYVGIVLTVDLNYPASARVEGYNVKFFVTPNAATFEKDYTISILNADTDEVLASRSGAGALSIEIDSDSINVALNYKVSVISTETIVYSTTAPPKVEVAVYDNDRAVVETNIWTSTNTSIIDEVAMSRTVPKIKVLDFLTGLFKMFNLTAYYIDDISDINFGKIYVDTLDNFYADAPHNPIGATIDITKYVDVQQHTVDSVLPYTDIKFEYQDTKVVLMETHFGKFNEVFGNSEYNVRRNFPDKVDRGTKYEIKLPFSHMKYERLVDLNGSIPSAYTNTTSIQWGYCASGDFNAVDEDAVPPEVPKGDYDRAMIKPLIFYGVLVTGLPDASAGNNNRSGRINWTSTTPPTAIESYWRPSNSTNDGTPSYTNQNTGEIVVGTPPSFTLNFDQEFDEWQVENYGKASKSLFNLYYKSYINSVFNVAKRLFKVTAYLPPRVIINYRLNDQIKIHDMMFRINSITTNLTTGKSELELLNIFSNEIVE